MASLCRISGVPQVLAKMKIAKGVIGLECQRRLKKAGLFIQRESQKIVPVEFGVLKNSARTVNMGGKEFDADIDDIDIVVHYGAGANYAVYVHENLEAKHKPGKRAKYLEAVVREQKTEIFKIACLKV